MERRGNDWSGFRGFIIRQFDGSGHSVGFCGGLEHNLSCGRGSFLAVVVVGPSGEILGYRPGNAVCRKTRKDFETLAAQLVTGEVPSRSLPYGVRHFDGDL